MAHSAPLWPASTLDKQSRSWIRARGDARSADDCSVKRSCVRIRHIGHHQFRSDTYFTHHLSSSFVVPLAITKTRGSQSAQDAAAGSAAILAPCRHLSTRATCPTRRGDGRRGRTNPSHPLRPRTSFRPTSSRRTSTMPPRPLHPRRHHPLRLRSGPQRTCTRT